MKLKHHKNRTEAAKALRVGGYRRRYSNVWMRFSTRGGGTWGSGKSARVVVTRGKNDVEILK